MRLPLALALVSTALVLTASAQAAKIKFTVNSVTIVEQQHDTTPKGKINKGDWILFKDLLLNAVEQFGVAKGKPIAYDVGKLVYRSTSDRRFTVTATFPHVGTITYVGDFLDSNKGVTVAQITGGTGGFKGVKGTVTIGNGTKAPNIYDITVPRPVNIGSSTHVA
jgi:hypothetical protein